MNEKEKKLLKSSSRKKLTKEEKKDAWTLVAILALFMLIAIGISLYKSKLIDTEAYSGMTHREKKEAAQDARDIMIGAGAVCFVVVVVYVVKRAGRRRANEKNSDKFLSEQQRLENARKRVEQARLNKLARETENLNGIEVKRKERLGTEEFQLYERSGNGAEDEPEHMNEEERQAYLEKRRRQYRYYMENEGETLQDEAETETASVGTDNKKWRIMAVVFGIVAIMAVVTIILMAAL